MPSLFEPFEPSVSPPRAASTFALRDYQERGLRHIEEALRDGSKATLCVYPTGTGKTVMFSHAIKRLSVRRALVVAHREELIYQAAEKIQAITGRAVHIEKAEQFAKAKCAQGSVVVASVQSLISGRGDSMRMERFDPRDFDLLVIDEAHHAVAPSYRKVIDYFASSGVPVIGVTATPDRADEEALGRVFDSVADQYEITDAIADGYLVPIRQRFVPVYGLDLSSVGTVAGDFNQGQLAAEVERDEPLHRIAVPTWEQHRGRKTIVFCVSVNQARLLAGKLNGYELGCAEWVCGETPDDQRRSIFRRYAERTFRILVNVGVATEGFDSPDTSLIVVARPTKSRALYAQMIGRGTRPLPGVVDGVASSASRRAAIAASDKPYCEVMDMKGNSGKHKLVSVADVLGGKYSDDVVERAKSLVDRGEGRDASDVTDAIAAAEAQLVEESRARRGLRIKAYYEMQEVDPFDMLGVTPARLAGWDRGKPLTDKMVGMLSKYNIDSTKLNYTQARQVIREIISRDMPTARQAATLKRHGFDPETCGFGDAKEIIDRIAARGWRLKGQADRDAIMAEIHAAKRAAG